MGAGPQHAGADGALAALVLLGANFYAEGLEALGALGDVEYANYREAHRLLTGDALVEALQDVDVFVTEIDVVDAASMARALPREAMQSMAAEPNFSARMPAPSP